MGILRNVLLIILTGLVQFASAADSEIQYLFPPPGARHVPAGSEILIRFRTIAPREIANLTDCISLTGGLSGPVSGEITLLTDLITLRFLPEIPFQPGETVTVRLHPLQTETQIPFADKIYTFTVYDKPETHRSDALKKNEPPLRPVFDYTPQHLKAMDPIVVNGVSVPANFPWIRVLVSDNPSGGYIFMNHGKGTSTPYNMILDNSGSPAWYLATTDERRDFKVHDNGKIGMMVRNGYPFGTGYIATDQNFMVTDSFYVDWNGYSCDEHELQILPDGSWFVIGIKRVTIDMSQVVPNGRTNASVSEGAIFGFPKGSHTPNFIWRAFDHMDIADTYVPGENELTGGFIRFPHMNAIDIDDDGQILLSSRHASEVTKINRQTGEIIWRLGGENNQFTFINDPLNGPENQHDIRSLGDSRYTVFDNGNEHNPSVSRGVEWVLDTNAMTATLVWEYRSDEFSNYMGNHQRLPNGNRLINWAVGSKLATEVRPDGSKALEFEFMDRSDCYRLFKFPWTGKVAVPYLVLEVYADAVTLLFNKFGDPDVDYYRIYADTHSNPTALLASSDQPFIHLNDELLSDRYYYFRVTAVNSAGQESGYSNEERVFIRLIEPGSNMVVNGDFENGFENWDWLVREGSADYEITAGHELHFIIGDGGSNDYGIQALYPGISLVLGMSYLFEFDAWADQNRPVFFDVRKDGDPYTNFSAIGGSALTRNKKHYAYEFTMSVSEPAARIVLNAGTDDADVYVDNVSLKQLIPEAVEEITQLPAEYRLMQNIPNPFNPATRIQYQIPEPAAVKISIFNTRGEQVRSLVNQPAASGTHRVEWNGRDDSGCLLGSGVYFCQLRTDRAVRTIKMILIR